MNLEYKTLLALGAIMIAIVSYVPYFRDIFRGKTKPHAFTWLIWGTLNGIAFLGQLSDSGGVGAWALGFTAIATLSIFGLSLFKGEKNIKPFDWFCLVGSFLAIVPWLLTNDPLLSVVLITLIDVIAFMPTVRKSVIKPHQETLITYFLSIFKYFFIVGALENYTVVTVLFPFVIGFMNLAFVVFILVRRRSMAAVY